MMFSDFCAKYEGDFEGISEIFSQLGGIARDIAGVIVESVPMASDSKNASGDVQMNLDVISDEIFFGALREVDSVRSLVSEEREGVCEVNEGGKYCIAYDPIDGSSLLDSNLSIGGIFGIFKGDSVLNQYSRDLVAAGYMVFGPRTLLVIAVGGKVFEFVVLSDGRVGFSRELRELKEFSKYFQPGNLRCCGENTGYRDLVLGWIDGGRTLRYSGALVADMHLMVSKGEGIFVHLPYSGFPNGKLRLAYEIGPFAYILDCLGGSAVDGFGKNILDIVIRECHQTTGVVMGSRGEVALVMEGL